MHWHSSEDSTHLAIALADVVARDLRTAIEARGQAMMALSGGGTPKRFMQELAGRDLDWAHVMVTLVDERWVPADHPRSNAGLLRANLLQGKATAARFIPLYADAASPEEGIGQVRELLDSMPQTLDVAVLGMGEDGHTASFFPGGDHLEQALDSYSLERVLPMRAPGAGEPRITLTLPVLVEARALYLLIEGDTKRQVLIEAVQGSRAPIGAVIEAAPGLQTYWCP